MKYFELFYLKTEEETLLQIKEHLLSHNINEFDEDNESLLETALQFRRTDAIDFLLNAEANPNIKSKKFYPLELLALMGEFDLCKKLFDNGAIIQRDNHILAISIMAKADYEFVEYLVNKGANVNDIYDDETALWWAFQAMNESVVGLLLKNGADPNHMNVMGLTCLTQAIADSFIAGINLLINYGANLDYPCQNPPLHMACKWCYPAVKILLDAGADINIVDNNGRTILFVERLRNDLALCDYLIKRGGDPMIKDNNGIDYFMLDNERLRYEIINQDE